MTLYDRPLMTFEVILHEKFVSSQLAFIQILIKIGSKTNVLERKTLKSRSIRVSRFWGFKVFLCCRRTYVLKNIHYLNISLSDLESHREQQKLSQDRSVVVGEWLSSVLDPSTLKKMERIKDSHIKNSYNFFLKV